MTESIGYSQFSRTTNLLTARTINRNLSETTTQLLTLQRQLASGRAIDSPSQDPFGSIMAIRLQALMEEKEQCRSNLEFGSGFLSASDSILGEVDSLIIDARELGLGEVGTTATDETQDNAALVIDNILEEIVSLANSSFREKYLFGGTSTQATPFERLGSYVRFNGNLEELACRSERTTEVTYSINAADAFGSFTAEVVSTADLSPALANTTLLSDLNGGEGVTPGNIIVSDGTNSTTVDLSACTTVQDVLDAASDALPSTTTMTLSVANSCFEFQSTLPGADLTVTEYAGGSTASDLGILQTTPTGSSFSGDDLDAKLTLLTNLGLLNDNTAIDASGFVISNGSYSATIDVTAVDTVGELITLINQSGIHVEASINEDATAIDLASRLCGAVLTVGENGGTTAEELGLRTMSPETSLRSLNLNEGVNIVDGNDLTMTFRDGTTLDIDLTGVSDVRGVINTINGHVDNGGRVTASLNTSGNGIVLADNTVDAGVQFSVANYANSTAATDLGIAKTCDVGEATLAGDDVGGMRSESIFTTLLSLSSALLDHDDTTISAAVEELDSDLDRVLNARAVVGSRINRLDTLMERIDQEELEAEATLSETIDLDFAEAMVRYSTLQAMLEASLTTAGTLVGLSLLDFLG